ncbi:MAG: hypothetical protein QE283_04270 [Rhodoferax sp.]|nr:hypothetical protein [Rhodoferax sp.]
MKAKKTAKPKLGSQPHKSPVAALGEAEQQPLERESTPIVERPDGYYWQAQGLAEVGPFETYELALASRDAVGEEVQGRSELLEAEREIGINAWLDAETGEPAEGQSPPHLEEE